MKESEFSQSQSKVTEHSTEEHRFLSKISQTRKMAIPGSKKWSFLLLRNLECSWLLRSLKVNSILIPVHTRFCLEVVVVRYHSPCKTKNEERRREKPSVLSKKPTRLTRCGAKKFSRFKLEVLLYIESR